MFRSLFVSSRSNMMFQRGNGRFFSSHRGTVKWFNPEKGYGFIAPEGATEEADLFVHVRSVAGGQLQDGDSVTFDREYNEQKGKDQATNVNGGSGAERQEDYQQRGNEGGGRQNQDVGF